MAVMDKKLEFSDAQAETTQATHDSTNVIDLGVASPGIDSKIRCKVRVNTTVTSDGSATVKASLQHSSNDSSYAVIADSAAHAKAALVEGFVMLDVSLPRQNLLRYLKVVYTIGTAALTAGKFDAWLEATN